MMMNEWISSNYSNSNFGSKPKTELKLQIHTENISYTSTGISVITHVTSYTIHYVVGGELELNQIFSILVKLPIPNYIHTELLKSFWFWLLFISQNNIIGCFVFFLSFFLSSFSIPMKVWSKFSFWLIVMTFTYFNFSWFSVECQISAFSIQGRGAHDKTINLNWNQRVFRYFFLS